MTEYQFVLWLLFEICFLVLLGVEIYLLFGLFGFCNFYEHFCN